MIIEISKEYDVSYVNKYTYSVGFDEFVSDTGWWDKRMKGSDLITFVSNLMRDDDPITVQFREDNAMTVEHLNLSNGESATIHVKWHEVPINDILKCEEQE